MLLIINADDFGKDAQTNQAILQSLKEGLCSSTTIMPNMPGFDEACQMAHAHKLLDHVGMHLVLADGFPLTEKIKRIDKFCDEEGQLSFSQAKPTFYLGHKEKRVLAEEIRAQIAKCRENGLPLTHMDSHYHIHNQWAIASVLIPILHEQKIPFLRLSRNCGPNLGLLKRFYKNAFNRKLRHEGLARTRYFGTIEDYRYVTQRIDNVEKLESFELVVHPLYGEENKITDGVEGELLENIVIGMDRRENMVSFNETIICSATTGNSNMVNS